jgi:phage shock protein C
MSPTTVRLIFVVSCLLPGPQFLVYLVLWAVMPSA